MPKTKEELLKELAALEEEEKKIQSSANLDVDKIAQAIKMALFGVNGLPNVPPVQPQKPAEEKLKEGTITLRNAAVEVYRKLITIETVAMAAIVFPLVCLIASIFNKYAGMAVAFASACYGGYQLFNAKKEQNYLNTNYKLK